MATVPLPGVPRPVWPRVRGFARLAVARARGWRLHAAAPALIGAGLVSAGVALVYLPAGLIAAGLLCLRFDSRL